MTIRQQYANEELVHKLRSMLNDLPTLRTRAMKKLEHWREAAIKRLLARQRELEKTLLDKFERLEFDTQLFVEKTERKRAQNQRRWQSEPLDYLNKSEIDRISTSLRSIREELEQSKLILAGNLANDNIGELSSETVRHEKLAETSARYADHISPKTAVHTNYNSSSTDNDLNLELKRVLEICTSPQCSSTSLSADEQTPLQSLDSVEHSNDAKAKQAMSTKTGTTYSQRRPDDRSRRHARIITNVLSEQQENEISSPTSSSTTTTTASNNNHETFPFESFDDSMRRFQRLREVQQNLRYKYDEPPTPPAKVGVITQPINIPIERIITPTSSNENNVSHQQRQRDHGVNTSNRTRDRKYRSKTLEGNQLRAVDNQIYGCSTSSLASKAKQDTHNRGDLHRHRSHRLSFRRSTDDVRSAQLHLRRHLDANDSNWNDIWLEIGQEHWTNLLENGWRPTTDTTGVNLVSFADSDDYGSSKQTTDENSVVDLYEQITRNEYISLFEKLSFSYGRTIDLGNEFWRFLEISGSQHLCLYHQLNKQFILFKPDTSLLSFQWPYDGIIDISWSKSNNTWVVATQTQITICNRSFSRVLQTVDINGDWPKRITSCRSSIFHTYKLPASSNTKTYSSSYSRSSYKDRPQFLLERYDYKLKSICKHILESSTIWDIEADDLTDHLAVLCDFALLIFDYQLNLLRQIEVTGFKVSTDHFGGWLIADYNASCIWQIRRNEYLKAIKILNVERPWSVILDRTNWTLVTLSETTNRAKRLLFYTMKNIPETLLQTDLSCAQSQLSMSSSSSISESLL
ncbi:unnamed protein product [Adineta ricciae]|uniref:Uncharacterized protein n=3 Tax=Adineta ricciae TaxID=249248 RepID=A0A815EJK9_ADIRI|nr:unnamed protein product [Adineta ricciae]